MDLMLEERIAALAFEKDRLYRVLDVNAFISASLNLNTVLDTIMEKAKELMSAEASSLMLLDEEKQELYFYTVKGEKSEAIMSIRLKMGEGISGWVAENGEPVLVADCSLDPRFSRKSDEKSSFVTKSMICVPLQVRKRVIGTVQILNKNDGTLFNSEDLKIFQVLATQAAIAIENARLHEMATRDSMTGLYLKHFFLVRLKDELRRSRKSGSPVSVIMADIDFFRNVNNTYGHQGGDTALVELARVIREAVESMSGEHIPARYGGEEFCALMPDTSHEEALKVAELIRKNIEATPISIGDQKTNITISVGVSNFPINQEDIQTEEDLIKLADDALYICKNRGRNCVALYHKDPSFPVREQKK